MRHEAPVPDAGPGRAATSYRSCAALVVLLVRTSSSKVLLVLGQVCKVGGRKFVVSQVGLAWERCYLLSILLVSGLWGPEEWGGGSGLTAKFRNIMAEVGIRVRATVLLVHAED